MRCGSDVGRLVRKGAVVAAMNEAPIGVFSRREEDGMRPSRKMAVVVEIVVEIVVVVIVLGELFFEVGKLWWVSGRSG